MPKYPDKAKIAAAVNARVAEYESLLAEIKSLRSERDAARAALGRVVFMWDEQIAKGLPFVSPALVPALREILAGYDYDRYPNEA